MNIVNKQDDEEILAEYNATVIEIRRLQERLQSLGQQLNARLDGGRNTNLLEKMRRVEQIG